MPLISGTHNVETTLETTSSFELNSTRPTWLKTRQPVRTIHSFVDYLS